MKRWWWVPGILVLCVLAGAAPGQARNRYDRPDGWGPDNSVRLRLGLFTPEGNGDYFPDKEQDFTGAAKDFEDSIGSGDYLFNLSDNVGLMLSGGYFEGRQDQSYRDFVDNHGSRITHTTRLEISPVTLGIVVRLAPQRSPVVPYAGAGGGAYVWRLEESGDFINFGVPSHPIFSDTLKANGASLGYYLLAGLDVPISPYFSIFAEGRWHRAEDDLGQDFEDFGTLDLSGREVAAGLAWHF
jgi:hypothetical protein